MTTRRRRVAALAIVGATLSSGMCVSSGAAQTLPPARCAGAIRVPESRDAAAGSLPVLLVHGFTGSPRDFRRRKVSPTTMVEGIASLDGIAAYTFDYSKRSSQWVTDPAIGPALAKAIDCLATRTGKKVVVVAHSMGGLATQLAQGQVVDGRPVADSIQRVVMIGTPSRGVILLSFTSGEVSSTIVQAVVDAAGEACGEPPREQRRRLCELLDAANLPAVGAMAPGSKELHALPRWAPGIVVAPMAADLRLRISVFGVGTTVSLGDIVATVESATANRSPGERSFVVHCNIGLDDAFEVVDRSPCSHANELGNRSIIRAVQAQVRAVRAATRASST